MSDLPTQLPTVSTSLGAEEIRTRLLKLSKRGKLAGYEAGTEGVLFHVEAHGTIFDFRLEARHADDALHFTLAPLWKLPIILVIATILAAGPGLWLTHSMMQTYFPSWYTISLLWTAAWYEPLTVLPLPWIFWGSWKKSKAAAKEHAVETIAKIGKELAA